MSILRNLLNNFVPVRERREFSAPSLGALNAELVCDVNGDSAILFDVRAGAAFTGTIQFQGSVDGINYFSVPAYPYSPAASGGTVAISAQPIVTEAFTTTFTRVYAVPCGQLRKVRLLINPWTSGTIAVVANSEQADESIHPHVLHQRASTLALTATGVAAAAVTATLPPVSGLRHYIDRIDITRSATVLLTAGAAPTLVTTTNIPGLPIFTFGASADAIGVDKTVSFDAGGSGLAASALGTATTIVCPATTGCIWRVNVAYRLGI